jgi:hypothetical protein
MIYVGVFVRLLIFTSWGGESIWWSGESWSFGAFHGRENEYHVMVLGGIWMDGV